MTVLGIDTSNYTTSLALVSDDGFVQTRRILEVKKGECGLRQSDALFLHTVDLPELFPAVFAEYRERFGVDAKVDAVAYSAYPRDVAGSYMPCFLAGQSAASAVASALGVPLMRFSHQAGHIMAALKTCGAEEKMGEEFFALHLSGGTTELVHAKKDDEIGFSAEIVGDTADISAGQLVDRAGVMLGLKFPCGGELEKLALGGLRRAVFEGDVDTGSLMAGQVAGMLHEIRPLREIFESLCMGGFDALKETQEAWRC